MNPVDTTGRSPFAVVSERLEFYCNRSPVVRLLMNARHATARA